MWKHHPVFTLWELQFKAVNSLEKFFKQEHSS